MFSEVTVSEQHIINKMGTGWHKPMSLHHQCDPNQVCTGNAHVGERIILHVQLHTCICYRYDSNN